MPIIRFDYDNDKLSEKEIKDLWTAIQEIVSEVTDIKDVFVYANASTVSINIAPIEIFIEMSAWVFEKNDDIMWEIKKKIVKWKFTSGFETPINLTIIPMNWKMEIWI